MAFLVINWGLMKRKEIILYQTKSGSIEFKGDLEKDTIWATQAQIAKVFNVTPQNVTIHLKNIFKEKELSQISTCKESLQVQIEGKRRIKRKVKEYNLDIIIAVGYRINSVVGTKFRQWATKTLKEHLINGYTINPNRIAQNYERFLESVEQVKKLLPVRDVLSREDVLELIKFFASTWFSLDAYDKSELPTKGATKRKVKIAGNELHEAITQLKTNLLSLKEATDIFAQEREIGSVTGIIGNVFQGLGGKDVYASIEEKAAHLLYFFIKNHPFVDGNKRTGAFVFVWFLNKAKILNKNHFTPEALTALTILVAESAPKDKERVVGLILNLLR